MEEAQAGRADDDWLVIYSLDRLGRNMRDLLEIEQKLFEKGVKLKVICQPIDTSNAGGRHFFHMLASQAQWEREWNWERTMHGLAKARDRGSIGGQPSPFSDKQIREALRKAKSVSGAAKLLGCAKITIHRRMKEWELAKEAAA